MNVNADLMELFKRIAFNIIVKNVDDHLRNHSFIYKNGGFSLSPAYDVNPTSYGKALSLNIDENNSELNVETLINTSEYYNIKNDIAKKIVSDISNLVKKNFKLECKKVSIPQSQMSLFQI